MFSVIGLCQKQIPVLTERFILQMNKHKACKQEQQRTSLENTYTQCGILLQWWLLLFDPEDGGSIFF
jgi:hypothetical protein